MYQAHWLTERLLDDASKRLRKRADNERLAQVIRQAQPDTLGNRSPKAQEVKGQSR